MVTRSGNILAIIIVTIVAIIILVNIGPNIPWPDTSSIPVWVYWLGALLLALLVLRLVPQTVYTALSSQVLTKDVINLITLLVAILLLVMFWPVVKSSLDVHWPNWRTLGLESTDDPSVQFWLWMQWAFLLLILALVLSFGPGILLVRLIVALLIVAFVAQGMTIWNQTPPGIKAKEEFRQSQLSEAAGNCPQKDSRKGRNDPRVHSVYLPSCADGWSEEVDVRPGNGQVVWTWPVQAELYIEGIWVPHVPNTYPDSEGARFCAKKSKHVAKNMPLHWN